jgi:hypothetical protein
MKQFLSKTLPENETTLQWIAIVFTIITSGLLTLWGIYGMGEYGIALFVFTPIFIGACPAIIYGAKKELGLTIARKMGFLSLSLFAVGLLVFAIEGLICIAMAMPIGLFLTWIGCLLGHFIVQKRPNNAPTSVLFLIVIIPTTALVEKDHTPELSVVTTSIEIRADRATVWKNVIEFPPLDAPTEFIFNTGIAYPINASIKGTGVGAIRKCTFTTGSFIEPITVWDEPTHLKFRVEEQPAPMKELSFWDIDAPHLHDYFVSKKGQFELISLPNGNTRLVGTTWYYHNIKPAFYWRIWSNYIIHKIHNRVLTHIKTKAEKGKETSSMNAH